MASQENMDEEILEPLDPTVQNVLDQVKFCKSKEIRNLGSWKYYCFQERNNCIKTD